MVSDICKAYAMDLVFMDTHKEGIKMETATKTGELSTLLWTGAGRIRKAVIWIMILAMVQILLLPVASHAEMGSPQISDSVGIGLLAGFVVFVIAAVLLSRKTELVATSHDQNSGNITTPLTDTAPSPYPAGTVAIVSWQ
jgi:uncharacterized membrane protein (DUF485 family)